jgi:hypothetical protein
MTEYRNCKRCGNENYGRIIICEYCGAIACEACEPSTACPKHPRHPGNASHSWEYRGLIAGFCDICHESMFGHKRYVMGEYSKISGHDLCLDEFLETEEGMNWDKEEKEGKRKAEELERKAKELAEEKERQKQEKLKSLVEFKMFDDPFDQSNPLYDHLKFEYYSKRSDENGNKYWIIYVSRDVADKVIAEQNRLKDEKRKAVEREQREIRKRRTIGRIKKIAYWLFYIIIGLVPCKD